MRNIYATVELHVLRTDLKTTDIFDLFATWGCFTQSQEVFWVIAYDAMTQLRSVIEVARGNEFNVEVDIASVFNAVAAAGATRFQVMHNHPSGEVEPTKRDFELTKQINVAAAINGRFLEDHLVIGPPRRIYSMKDHGRFTPSPAIKRLMAANGPSVWVHSEDD